jgi:16S rRNA (adenine(1408)-N(1))-methyltransferase
LIARHQRVVADLGTGDGKAVLRRARREPQTLVVGMDADAAAMREASQRGARPARKGGVANALFLAAAAEELPGSLAGTIDELTVVLPWGSLLGGLAKPDPQLLDALCRSLRPTGRLELLLSVQPTDRSRGLPILDEPAVERLLQAYAAAGLFCIEARLADAGDVDRLGSSWARRLGMPDRRPAWLLVVCPSAEVRSSSLSPCSRPRGS